jgi:hypothetical protein
VSRQREQYITANVVEAFLQIGTEAAKIHPLLDAKLNVALQAKPNVRTFTTRKKSLCLQGDRIGQELKDWLCFHA